MIPAPMPANAPTDDRALGLESRPTAAADPAVDATTDGPHRDQGANDPLVWIGKVIDGRYRVLELLGEGGMGAVFVAENLNLRKQVALKVIRGEFAEIPEIAARFAREAMATATVDHPHIVRALDYGALDGGGAFLVIQLVRGVSLRSHLEREALAWPGACEIAAQIADALAAAHAAGIVHRDLKPDNILLERRDDGRYHVRVVDFGIARIAGEVQRSPQTHEALTRMGMVMGTPGYMAPEQALGEQVDHRVDLYALGVILWESIAGRTLWRGDSLTEIVTGQLAESPPLLAGLLAQPIPEPLDQLIQQLVARAPSARPAAAAPIRDALRKLALGAGEVTPAPAPGLDARRITEVAHQPQRPPPPLDAARRWIGARWSADRRPFYAIFAALPLLLLLALLLLSASGDDGDEGDDAPTSEPRYGDPPARAEAPKNLIEASSDRALEALQPSQEARAHLDILLNADDGAARTYAAGKLRELLPAEPLPSFTAPLIDLELASKCASKRAALDALRAAADPRALPALERLSATPRDGCGNFWSRRDCLACLRKPLAAAISELSAQPADKPADKPAE
jgi:serine/threonine protein kinase